MLIYHSVKMEAVASRGGARRPRCARCRNHGLAVDMKGHAGRCRFSGCRCWKCALITERSRIMARQRGTRKSECSQGHERAAGEPGNRIDAPSELHSYPARAADTEDRTYTALGAPEPAASSAWAPNTDPEIPQNSFSHCKAKPHRPWEYLMTEIPRSPAHWGDPAVAIPFNLHAHYGSAYAHPAFLLSFGTPPHGAIGFAHVPQTTLMTESRQENPGFFHMPYLLPQKPDHYLQSIREGGDRADSSAPQHGRDSGGTDGSQL